MNFLSNQPKTRLLIIFLGLFLGLTFLIVLTASVFTKPAVTPPSENLVPKTGIPIQIENKNPKQEITFTNYLQTIIGQTTDQEISKFTGLKKTEALGNARTAYYFPSSDPLRDNVVETKDGKAIFKRVVAVTSKDYRIGRFSPYLQQYGKPDAEYAGSGRYGPMYKTYVYAKRGFAFIVSPENDAVYEIQSFIPVTVDAYLVNWGDDIREAKEQELRRAQEGFNEGATE